MLCILSIAIQQLYAYLQLYSSVDIYAYLERKKHFTYLQTAPLCTQFGNYFLTKKLS